MGEGLAESTTDVIVNIPPRLFDVTLQYFLNIMGKKNVYSYKYWMNIKWNFSLPHVNKYSTVFFVSVYPTRIRENGGCGFFKRHFWRQRRICSDGLTKFRVLGLCSRVHSRNYLLLVMPYITKNYGDARYKPWQKSDLIQLLLFK